MPLSPYLTPEQRYDKSPIFAKGVIMATAVGSCLLLGILLIVLFISALLLEPERSLGGFVTRDLVSLCWVPAAFFSLVGSISCTFAVSYEFQKKHRWVRRCAFANYTALSVAFLCPWIIDWMRDHVLLLPFVMAALFLAVVSIGAVVYRKHGEKLVASIPQRQIPHKE